MPLTSKKQFDDITMYLSILRNMFESSSKQGYLDLNKSSENFFKDMLNIIYDRELVNLNLEHINHPAIDLGDKKNRVCIQVTASNGSDKIKETLDTFFLKDLDKEYDKLIILIITSKLNYRADLDKTKGNFSFLKDKDIIDINDLLREIESLKGKPKLGELHDLIRSELPDITRAMAPSDSLLARIPQNQTPPKNALKFFDKFNFEAEERDPAFRELKKFYNKLISFAPITKEVLYFALTSCYSNNLFDLNELSIKYFNSNDIELKKHMDILIRNDLVRNDPDANCSVLTLGMDDYGGLHSLLKEYAQTDKKLKEIIIDCDFTLLDS